MTATTVLPSEWKVKAVGVTFIAGYPDNLHRLHQLQQQLARRLHAEPFPIVLTRDPDNKYDPNAIQIHQPIVGMIGHIPRDLAARLAPELDNGTAWEAWVEQILITPGEENKPGILVGARRVTDSR